MPTSAAKFRRFVAGATAPALYAGAGNHGLDAEGPRGGRELLANAIAGTRGSYLVYDFGGGNPAPMLNAGGSWYEMTSGGHLMIVKSASQRLTPRLLVDSHSGYQSRCERDPRARTGEGLFQASGQPTIAIKANFFDIRGQRGGSWKSTGCSSPLGAYVDNTRGQGRANAPVTGTIAYAGKQGLSGGDAPFVVPPRAPDDYDAASPVIKTLMDKDRGSSQSAASDCWPQETPRR